MTRTLTTIFRSPLKAAATLGTAALIALATVSTPTPAEARNRGAAIIGGIALGVIAASALAAASRSHGYYHGGPVYYHRYRPVHCRWHTNWVWNGWQMIPVRQKVCY
jgi:hypothetical protein